MQIIHYLIVSLFQPDDEFADGYEDEFDEEHEYDTPAEGCQSAPPDQDSSHYQKPRSPPCEMSKYDTPHSTIESNARGKEPTPTSMEFAVGTQFDAAMGPLVNIPSYNNPLAAAMTVEDIPSIYDTPADPGREIF